MARRRGQGENKLRARLIRRLAEAGVTLDAASIQPALGWYRSAFHADTYRWTAFGKREGGIPELFTCYDTMTKCARYGVVIGEDNEVSAKDT